MRRTLLGVTGLVLAGGMLGLVGCVPPPAIIQVTTTADVVADDGVTSLREAFALANRDGNADTIQLDFTVTYDLTNCIAGALLHTRPTSLTIVANGSTIRQRCVDAGILASTDPASALVLNDLVLVGGPNSGVTLVGAGINVRGSLSTRFSVVRDVDAGRGGTVVEVADGPAAEDAFLSFTNVHDNIGTGINLRGATMRGDSVDSSGNDGDGIRMLGNNRLTGEFVGASDNLGWGLKATGDGLTVVDVLNANFNRNALGGVSCFGCSEAGIQESQINDNGTFARPGDGGGIAFSALQRAGERAPFVQLFRTTIRGNVSRRAGGGVFSTLADGSSLTASGPVVVLSDTTIEGNRTEGDGVHGGGIAVLAGTVFSQFTEISGNATGPFGDGGGLYFVSDDPQALALSAEVESNRAGHDGGGVFIETEASVTLDGRFAGNTGGLGGGAYVSNDDAGIAVNGEFIDNVGGFAGGGLYLDGVAAVRNSLVQGNQAVAGGGIHAADGQVVSVERSTVARNTARQGGGIYAFHVNRLELDHSTVSGNVALEVGGGLVGGANLTMLTFTTVAGNTSPVGANLTGGPLGTYASLLVEPLGGAVNCAIGGPTTPIGYSFLSDTSCGVHPTDTVFFDDPELGPLDRGVRTPEANSPVGGTVPVEVCLALVDQLGVSRPQGAACEPGSVEIEESGTPSSS
jgi:hypothetical protein